MVKTFVSFSRQSLRQAVSFVPQDSLLFEGTLFDNIRYARPEASRREVLELLIKLGISDLLTGLPEGLETSILEGGANLSKGMRQFGGNQS